MSAPLVELARAKVNLSLHVLGRRADGFHDLDSLVAFARCGDTLRFTPGGQGFTLRVTGREAKAAGPVADNLVLRAAGHLNATLPQPVWGAFHLIKRLPVAAGLGGGSADAAAALRLLARVAGLTPDDCRLIAAAEACGADVPVCLDSKARVMAGKGHDLGPVLALPSLPCLIVNPRKPMATPPVFKALGLAPGATFRDRLPDLPSLSGTLVQRRERLIEALHDQRNDLSPPALTLEPDLADVQAQLAALPGCRLARMSGSGASFYALFDTRAHSLAAARALRAAQPHWWVVVSAL